MMDLILQADEVVFKWINQDLHNPVLDAILPYWREKKFWYPFYLVMMVFILFKHKLKGLYLLLALFATVGLADTVSSKILKPTVKRVRPCNDPAMQADVKLLVGCGRAYSFTSSHAANHFAIAGFLVFTLGWRYRSWKWWLFFWAGSIAFAQVYVGVHYPLDVIFGTLVGLLAAAGISWIYHRFSWSISSPKA